MDSLTFFLTLEGNCEFVLWGFLKWLSNPLHINICVFHRDRFLSFLTSSCATPLRHVVSALIKPFILL